MRNFCQIFFIPGNRPANHCQTFDSMLDHDCQQLQCAVADVDGKKVIARHKGNSADDPAVWPACNFGAIGRNFGAKRKVAGATMDGLLVNKRSLHLHWFGLTER